MTKDQVFKAGINHDSISHGMAILHKLVLTAERGFAELNGQPLSNRSSLAEYLFSPGNIIIDLKSLSSAVQQQFEKWFWLDYQATAERYFLTEADISEKLGYSLEKQLNPWEKILNTLIFQKKSFYWPLGSIDKLSNLAIKGIEINAGEKGLLISFHTEKDMQKASEANVLKNKKTVRLTEPIINQLVTEELAVEDLTECLSKPHAFAVNVLNDELYQQAMREYQIIHGYEKPSEWFWSKWIKNNDKKALTTEKIDNRFNLVYKEEKIRVYYSSTTQEILIKEKCPDLEIMVFCGGGAKIYALLGAYKAFLEANIQCKRFAGSSAGAIMALMCYLGYSYIEIEEFFRDFKKEHIIFYNIDRRGISSSEGMKAALDYMIIKKVNQIIQQYKIDKTDTGKAFLREFYKPGKITFHSLMLLKQNYPQCSIGTELIVTGTEEKTGATHFFSAHDSPNEEVSASVCASAALPVYFKPLELANGNVYLDGGVKNNLPSDLFIDDKSTLISSEHNNNLKMVLIVLDNGPEGQILKTHVREVYRENFILNRWYAFITGVSDPATGWENDRKKLYQLAHCSVVIPTDSISALEFDLNDDKRATLLRRGYEAANNYIYPRYQKQDDEGMAHVQWMYQRFTDIYHAIHEVCLHGKEEWFHFLVDKIGTHLNLDKEKISFLHERYFSKTETIAKEKNSPIYTFFNYDFSEYRDYVAIIRNHTLFIATYPILIKMPSVWIPQAEDLKLFRLGRHSYASGEPSQLNNTLKQLKGPLHILLIMCMQILLSKNREPFVLMSKKLNHIEKMINTRPIQEDKIFIHQWNLSPAEIDEIFLCIIDNNWPDLKRKCEKIKLPTMQLIKKSSAIQIQSNNDELKSFVNNIRL